VWLLSIARSRIPSKAGFLFYEIITVFNKIAQLLKGRNGAPKGDLTPDQEIETAEKAFAKGDLKHAAYHVGCALVSDPNKAEWLSLLEKISAASPKPLDLAPLADRNFIGTIAVRAYLLAGLSRWTEALELLLQVASQAPDIGFLQWAINWVKLPAAGGKIDPGPIVGFCGRILDRIPELRADDASRVQTLDRVPVLIEEVVRTQAVDGQSFFAFVVILKRIGCFDLMRTMAEEQHAKSPNYHTANAMASAARAAGDVDKAIAMYRQALTFDNYDISVRLDIGDLLLETGRYTDAGSVYAEVLHLQPDHEWAAPSFYAAQALARGDEASRTRFDVFVEDNPGNQRARDLASFFAPYFGDMLPPPHEASISGVNQLLTGGLKPGSEGTVKMGLSSLEAPSAIFACNLELRRRFGECRLVIDATPQTSPDPREPRVPTAVRLWTYEGINANPALSPPSLEVAAMVREIAVSRYSANAWFTLGKEVGGKIGPGRVDDLVASMVHPLPAFGQYRSWEWLLRTQYAACFAMAGVDGGWAGSKRRETLLSILGGQADWSTGGAAIVLALIVRECPDAEAEISGLLWDSAVHLLRLKGSISAVVEPVLLALQHMPNLVDARRQQVNQTLSQIWSE